MSGSVSRLAALGSLLLAAACADITSGNEAALELPLAFQSVPMAFSASSNSFDASGDRGEPFEPESMSQVAFHNEGGQRGAQGDSARRHGGDHGGFGKGGLRGLLMGGGLGPDFTGILGFGKGRGRGPFGQFRLPASCAYDSTTERVTCPEHERHGMTVNLSVAFKDTAGVAQQSFDTVTTDYVNVRAAIEGTKSRGNRSSTIAHSSDRTITGLAQGSTQRVVNGVAEASEITTGTREDTRYTAIRQIHDTVANLVVPIADGRPTIPSSGVVVRRMLVSITPEGGTERTRFRREKLTFDGSNVIQVEVTQDDVTRNCTITLPSRRLVCGD